jgi:hypothetical protein
MTPPKDAAAPLKTDRRRQPSVTGALATLQQISDLCKDPARHTRRLQRRLAALDPPLLATEAKAFAIQAWARARRNREAFRALARSWRDRRRARRETG